MRKWIIPVTVCLFLVLFLVRAVHAQGNETTDSSQDVNLLDVPKNLASALGIPEYAGKLLMCALFTFWLLFPTAIYAKKNLEYIFILEGFLLLGFFIAVAWIEYWYMLVYVLVVAGLWAGKMKGIFY
ncbi:hypothetical protein MUP01_12725 [Candidatus Bathyarchaeota archaeon]|nr:hypothetical protein [Candidatus Bathyarchaeota archaeon]